MQAYNIYKKFYATNKSYMLKTYALFTSIYIINAKRKVLDNKWNRQCIYIYYKIYNVMCNR